MYVFQDRDVFGFLVSEILNIFFSSAFLNCSFCGLNIC